MKLLQRTSLRSCHSSCKLLLRLFPGVASVEHPSLRPDIYAAPFIFWYLQFSIFKGDFSKTLNILLHDSLPVVQSQVINPLIHNVKLFKLLNVSRVSNFYSFISKQWSMRLPSNSLQDLLLYEFFYILQENVFCGFRCVHCVFFPCFKWFLSATSSEPSLSLNNALELPALKLLPWSVFVLPLCPLNPNHIW